MQSLKNEHNGYIIFPSTHTHDYGNDYMDLSIKTRDRSKPTPISPRPLNLSLNQWTSPSTAGSTPSSNVTAPTLRRPIFRHIHPAVNAGSPEGFVEQRRDTMAFWDVGGERRTGRLPEGGIRLPERAYDKTQGEFVLTDRLQEQFDDIILTERTYH